MKKTCYKSIITNPLLQIHYYKSIITPIIVGLCMVNTSGAVDSGDYDEKVFKAQYIDKNNFINQHFNDTSRWVKKVSATYFADRMKVVAEYNKKAEKDGDKTRAVAARWIWDTPAHLDVSGSMKAIAELIERALESEHANYVINTKSEFLGAVFYEYVRKLSANIEEWLQQCKKDKTSSIADIRIEIQKKSNWDEYSLLDIFQDTIKQHSTRPEERFLGKMTLDEKKSLYRDLRYYVEDLGLLWLLSKIEVTAHKARLADLDSTSLARANSSFVSERQTAQLCLQNQISVSDPHPCFHLKDTYEGGKPQIISECRNMHNRSLEARENLQEMIQNFFNGIDVDRSDSPKPLVLPRINTSIFDGSRVMKIEKARIDAIQCETLWPEQQPPITWEECFRLLEAKIHPNRSSTKPRKEQTAAQRARAREIVNFIKSQYIFVFGKKRLSPVGPQAHPSMESKSEEGNLIFEKSLIRHRIYDLLNRYCVRKLIEKILGPYKTEYMKYNASGKANDFILGPGQGIVSEYEEEIIFHLISNNVLSQMDLDDKSLVEDMKKICQDVKSIQTQEEEVRESARGISNREDLASSQGDLFAAFGWLDGDYNPDEKPDEKKVKDDLVNSRVAEYVNEFIKWVKEHK